MSLSLKQKSLFPLAVELMELCYGASLMSNKMNKMACFVYDIRH